MAQDAPAAFVPPMNLLFKTRGKLGTMPALMRHALLPAILMGLVLRSTAAEPPYPHEVSQWQEVAVPSKIDQAAYAVWGYAANYSPYDWRVFADGDRICAQLVTEKIASQKDRPSFDPQVGQFRSDRASFAAVDDGWMVGFNDGEFGAALYWFSRDGKQNYKVSDDQVVDFFSLSDGLYAVQGLAHMGSSGGSVIRIVRPQPQARWQATPMKVLPFAPRAVSVCKNGTMLITLSDSLVSVGQNQKIETLLPDAVWAYYCYPNSSVLSRDEQKLYIGMRQFVGEFDLTTKKLRLLVPSNQFLNKLPAETEQQLRKQSGSLP